MNVELFEQETIINFNREEKEATIFTYEKTWQNHLEDRLHLKPTMDNGFGGREYVLDKKRISMPRAPRKMTAKALKALEAARKKRALRS